MRELASVEMHVLVSEMQSLVGMYIKKFYDLGDGAFKLAISGKDGTLLLYCKLVRTINLTSFTETAGEATNFAMAMRKRIEGSKVSGVEQGGMDRVMIISTEGHENFRIVIEMYGKGNMLLLDKDGTIVLAYKVMDQRSRTIRVKKAYELPVAQMSEFGDAQGVENAIDRAKSIENRLISTLSSAMNLGPLYIEEIINSSGLDPNMKSLDYSQMKKLKAGIFRFYERLGSEKPRIYMDKEGKHVDYAVVSIEKYINYEPVEFASLSALLDKFYLGERSQSRNEVDRRLEELRASIGQQRELIKRFEADGAECFEAGNMILNNMNEINRVIDYLRLNKRATLEETRKAFAHLQLDKLDLKDKTIEMEIE